MSTHNICFHRKIRKIFMWVLVLSTAMSWTFHVITCPEDCFSQGQAQINDILGLVSFKSRKSVKSARKKKQIKKYFWVKDVKLCPSVSSKCNEN